LFRHWSSLCLHPLVMGACCSWCKEEDAYAVRIFTNSQFSTTKLHKNLAYYYYYFTKAVDQERTHLLIDPDCNNTSVQRGGIPEDYHYGSLPKESEEQAGLNRILEEISSWVFHFFDMRTTNKSTIILTAYLIYYLCLWVIC